MGRIDYETETLITHTLRADGFDASEDGTGRGTPIVPVAFSSKDYGADAGELAPTLRGMAVRRLTPVECEKLQGVPPGFTLVPYRGKPMADGPRYKMLGNGFAIPVLAWIARRIEEALRTAAGEERE